MFQPQHIIMNYKRQLFHSFLEVFSFFLFFVWGGGVSTCKNLTDIYCISTILINNLFTFCIKTYLGLISVLLVAVLYTKLKTWKKNIMIDVRTSINQHVLLPISQTEVKTAC